MIDVFPTEYIHMIVLGIPKRMLNIWQKASRPRKATLSRSFLLQAYEYIWGIRKRFGYEYPRACKTLRWRWLLEGLRVQKISAVNRPRGSERYFSRRIIYELSVVVGFRVHFVQWEMALTLFLLCQKTMPVILGKIRWIFHCSLSGFQRPPLVARLSGCASARNAVQVSDFPLRKSHAKYPEVSHEPKYGSWVSFPSDCGTHFQGQHECRGQIPACRPCRLGQYGKLIETNQTVFFNESPNHAVIFGHSPAVIVDVSQTALLYGKHNWRDNYFTQTFTSFHLGIFKCKRSSEEV